MCFFFQAEDGIRDYDVTGVQTCPLPILRMGLYRRLAWLSGKGEIDAFAAELIDRFGPLPDQVENLLQTVALKKLCREAGIEKVEAGAKGAVLSFRKNEFANPAGMVEWITGHQGTAKLRPDHKLALIRSVECRAGKECRFWWSPYL